ncbi:unnamed protein product [Lasius platythorax]|uniref:Gag protein n=1 Tax=Lasius platythorax TaxID=488582 RepID=A0AAV2MWQ5_9HYME
MAHSTRSHGSIPKEAKTELRQKTSEDREKQTREPSKTLSRVSDSIDANSLFQVLSQIQNELHQLRKLPDHVNALEQRMNEASRAASVYEDDRDIPIPDEQSLPVPTLKLKDVVANIPSYNGYNISIFQFARACERARNLLSSVQEPQLVQFIITKLEADAYQVIEGNIYTRVVDILDKLKAIFAPNKSIAQYRGELANTYKLPGETILHYAGKIKDLKSAILDGNRRQGKGMKQSFADEIDEEVLEAFINGLRSNIITRMEHRSITNLDEAIEWAVKISNNLEAEKAHERSSAQKSNFVIRSDAYSSKPPDREKEQLKSILRNPNFQAPKPWIRPLIPGVPGPNSPDVCRYCKYPGHSLNECRKLAFRNTITQQNAGNERNLPVASAARETTQTSAHPITITDVTDG